MLGLGLGLHKSNRVSGGIAPVNTVAPVVSAPSFEVGQTLTSTTGTWTGTPTITYSYQWKRGVTNIGTDSATYVAVTADLEQNITCTVTATNSFGNASQVSNTVVIVFNRLAHGLKWSVDTNNKTEVGTTTTLVDYFGNNNLSNPLATNQPLTVVNVLNGKSILRFTTDDILVKTVANWFAADTSGHITLVVKSNSTLLKTLFGSCDDASTRIWDVRKDATGKLNHLHNVGNTQSGTIIGTNNLGTTTWKAVTIASNGSAHKLFISSATETISSNTLTGGIWLADFPTQRDNITLGGLKFNATFSYGEADIYGAYYGSDFADATILTIHSNLIQICGPSNF